MMKRLILFSTLVLFLLSSCDSPMSDLNGDQQQAIAPNGLSSRILPGTPPAKADSIRKAVFETFKDKNGPEWRITWNEKTNIPLTVFSGTTKPYSGHPEQEAKRFLKENSQLFGMKSDLSDLKLLRIDTQRNIRHVRFQQTFRGVPVYDTHYLVHFRPDGRIDMANGHYYPNIEAPGSPGISASAAQQTALDDLGGTVNLTGDIGSELVIYPVDKQQEFLLVWRVIVPANAPIGGDWQYMIDAANGQIVDKFNLATSVTGDGDIIEEHPGITPNPANRDFYRLNGSGYLRGTYANVHNDVASRAFSSSHSFQYNTSNTHFDEANVYWHIDTYRNDYLANLGFNKKIGSDHDLEAYVHDVTRGPNGAFYWSNNHSVTFGNNFEFAKEDKIIYHEFVHAVAHAVHGSLQSTDDEQGAISEGNADYFAGSYTGRTLILDSLPFANRNMANPGIGHYSNLARDGQGDVIEPAHNGGEFWSAALWDLRDNIGASQADFLVYDALNRVSGNPTFIEYRDAIIAADNAAYGGANNNQIQDAFYFRGIGDYSLTANISGPLLVREGNTETWTGSGSGGSPPYSNYNWRRRDTASDPWSPVGSGTQYTETISSRDDFQLQVCLTDAATITRCSVAVDIHVH